MGCDIIGLYLNPPDQALERTRPMLPMGMGYIEGITLDYARHDDAVCSARRCEWRGAVAVQAAV